MVLSNHYTYTEPLMTVKCFRTLFGILKSNFEYTGASQNENRLFYLFSLSPSSQHLFRSLVYKGKSRSVWPRPLSMLWISLSDTFCIDKRLKVPDLLSIFGWCVWPLEMRRYRCIRVWNILTSSWMSCLFLNRQPLKNFYRSQCLSFPSSIGTATLHSWVKSWVTGIPTIPSHSWHYPQEWTKMLIPVYSCQDACMCKRTYT